SPRAAAAAPTASSSAVFPMPLGPVRTTPPLAARRESLAAGKAERPTSVGDAPFRTAGGPAPPPITRPLRRIGRPPDNNHARGRSQRSQFRAVVRPPDGPRSNAYGAIGAL